MKNVISYLGTLVVYSVKHTNGINDLLFKTIKTILITKTNIKEIINQMFVIGNKSIPFMTIIMGILGMILVTQFGMQGVKLTGTAEEVGGLYLQLIVRQFGPFITGMMLATKITTSMAAEISSMKVNNQLDVLKMDGINIISYIVSPKFIASLIMINVIIIYSTFVLEVSGILTAKAVFSVNPDIFLNYQFVTATDIFQGMLKSLFISVYIPITGCYAGLMAEGGSKGVGTATNKGVVFGLSAVGVIDLVCGAFIFIFF